MPSPPAHGVPRRRISQKGLAVQLRHDVVSVAAIIALGEFGSASVSQKAAAFDEQARHPRFDTQNFGLLGCEGNRAQSLQRPRRQMPSRLQRFVKRRADGFDRGQALGGDRCIFERHRRVVGIADAMEAIDERSR